MGQAFRRATSRLQSGTGTGTSSRIVVKSNNSDRRPPPPKVELKPKIRNHPYQDGVPETNPDNVLEDKDPGYDAMLSQMVGRIKTKPGGKLEMGEAFIVEKYDRPMPKLRNTKSESNYDEEKVTPPGTLNVAQLREMLRLHQSKTMDPNGTLDVHHIAKSFRLDAMQVEKVLQFVSLPPQDSSSKQQDR